MKAVLFAGVCFLLRKSIDFEASLPPFCAHCLHTTNSVSPARAFLQPGTLPHGRTFQAIPKAHASLQPRQTPKALLQSPPPP